MDLKERIDFVTKKYKVSRIDLAEQCGVSQAQLFNYLRGSSVPNMNFFLKFKNHYPTLNLDWLITGEGDTYIELEHDRSYFFAAVEHCYQRSDYSSLNEFASFLKVPEEVITNIFEKKLPPDTEVQSKIAIAFNYDLPTFLKVGKHALTSIDNTFNELVGRNLRKIREYMKLTPEQFGEKLNIPATTILMFEDGAINFPDELIEDLANRCFVNPKFLKTGQGEMFTKNPLFFLDEDVEFVYKLREELDWKLDEETEKDLINLIRNRYKKGKEELKEKFADEKEKLEKELKTETTGIIEVMKGGQH